LELNLLIIIVLNTLGMWSLNNNSTLRVLKFP
jgi:hypothetical protein